MKTTTLGYNINNKNTKIHTHKIKIKDKIYKNDGGTNKICVGKCLLLTCFMITLLFSWSDGITVPL